MFELYKAGIFVDVPYLKSRVFRYGFIPVCIAAISFTMLYYSFSSDWTAEDEQTRAYAQEHYEWIQAYNLISKSKSGLLFNERYTFEVGTLGEASEVEHVLTVSRRDYKLYDAGDTIYLIDVDGVMRIVRGD